MRQAPQLSILSAGAKDLAATLKPLTGAVMAAWFCLIQPKPSRRVRIGADPLPKRSVNWPHHVTSIILLVGLYGVIYRFPYQPRGFLGYEWFPLMFDFPSCFSMDLVRHATPGRALFQTLYFALFPLWAWRGRLRLLKSALLWGQMALFGFLFWYLQGLAQR